jgi:SAM-dependent methyltransferase
MTGYALLILPAANRVYAQAAPRLTLAELAVFNQALLGGLVGDLEETAIAGVPYVTFSAEGLDERHAALLANLSSIYALFEREGALLRPIPLRRLDRFDDDLVTIQRYQGKTNEQFTKLLLNLALCATTFAGELLERRFKVMDPLCGRGTTLNQALLYGFDAAGMDIDARDFDAYARFIQTWLKHKRLKHHAGVGPVRRHHRTVGRRLQVTFAATKEAYRAGDVQELEVVNADTTQVLEFYRRGAFDVVVADLPYGVQHGSRTAERGVRRGPAELLAAALPVWSQLLRPGGAVGVSWNTHLARRDRLVEILDAAGLEVLDGKEFRQFEHRVDQAITRDVLLARPTR